MKQRKQKECFCLEYVIKHIKIRITLRLFYIICLIYSHRLSNNRTPSTFATTRINVEFFWILGIS